MIIIFLSSQNENVLCVELPHPDDEFYIARATLPGTGMEMPSLLLLLSSPDGAPVSSAKPLPWMRRLASFLSASVTSLASLRMSGVCCGWLGECPIDMPARIFVLCQ